MAKIKLRDYKLFVEPFVRQTCKMNKETGCLEWQGARNKQGYGIVKHRYIGPDFAQVHRVMFTLHKGEIPDDGVIMHNCDNPCCCNPSHLTLGTSKLNTLDMLKKDRQSSKLKYKDVVRIKKDIALRHVNRMSLERIAEKYDVSRTTINFIRMGKTWKHVPEYNRNIPEDAED